MRQLKTNSPLGIGIKKGKTLYWTAHAKGKMMQYRLSEGRIKRVLHSPERVETGIAPETIAVMQTQKGPKNSHEIWAMVADDKVRRRVISAWRYPGKTKSGEPLPPEILREFRSCLSVISSVKTSDEKSRLIQDFLKEKRKIFSKRMSLIQKKWFKQRASRLSSLRHKHDEPVSAKRK